jgi:hypothetical protein
MGCVQARGESSRLPLRPGVSSRGQGRGWDVTDAAQSRSLSVPAFVELRVSPFGICCESPASDATAGRCQLSVDYRKTAPGAAGLHMVAGLALLRPREQMFTAMLDGWGSQQLARKLAAATVAGRQRVVRAFASHAGGVPVGVDAADGR